MIPLDMMSAVIPVAGPTARKVAAVAEGQTADVRFADLVGAAEAIATAALADPPDEDVDGKPHDPPAPEAASWPLALPPSAPFAEPVAIRTAPPVCTGSGTALAATLGAVEEAGGRAAAHAQDALVPASGDMAQIPSPVARASCEPDEGRGEAAQMRTATDDVGRPGQMEGKAVSRAVLVPPVGDPASGFAGSPPSGSGHLASEWTDRAPMTRAVGSDSAILTLAEGGDAEATQTATMHPGAVISSREPASPLQAVRQERMRNDASKVSPPDQPDNAEMAPDASAGTERERQATCEVPVRPPLFASAMEETSETSRKVRGGDLPPEKTDPFLLPVQIGPSPSAGQPSPLPGGFGMPPPRTPIHGLAQQLAGAMSQGRDGPVEVMLSPEELGRVRMTIVSDGTGLTLTMVAERPETLDLLRRHIDILAQDFRDMGFGTLSFAFSQEGHDASAQFAYGPNAEAPPDDPQPAPTPPATAHGRISVGGGTAETLDLRL